MGLWDKESQRHQEKNTETTQRHCKEQFQAIHQPAPCKQLKQMLLLNFVEGYLNVLKEALLEATDRSCGWTKGPPRNKETLWWNVSKSVSEKQKLWSECKQGNTSKKQYLELKKKARRTVYQNNREKEKT